MKPKNPWSWQQLADVTPDVAAPTAPETFLTRCYGTPAQVGQIVTIKELRGRAVAETTSGIPVILPIGGFDIATYLDHTDV